MRSMTSPDLQTCLANLEHDKHYRVAEMLKSSEFETTEVVVYEPDELSAESSIQPGARYIRKQIANASDAGSAYELLYLAEKQGRKLACAPRVLDCYDIPGYKVVILEYLEGETLDAWIAQHGAGEQTTRLLFPKLCDAVVQLHAAFEPALIHRDIKPSNIIILGDGLATGGTADRTVDGAVDRLAAAGRSDDGVADLNVRLLDFGIARVFNEESDCDTHALGTRSYAPPEQFGFGQTDVRSDVYALGAVLYFMLTGATPQASFSSQEKRDVFLRAANPALAAVIRKASAFDPLQRYQSVGELKAAFLYALPASSRETIERGATSNFVTNNVVTHQRSSEGLIYSSESPSPTSQVLSPSSKETGSKETSGVSARAIGGIIWDVLLFLVLALFLWGCAVSALNPSETQAAIPVVNLWVASMGLAIMFVGIAFLLFDRAPFTFAFPILERYTLKWRFIIGLSISVGGFLIMFVSLGFGALA